MCRWPQGYLSNFDGLDWLKELEKRMKFSSVFVLSLLVTFSLLHSRPVLAFESKGHRIVARIAQNHLTPEVQARIDVITEGRSLAQLSTWPDKIRQDVDWKHAAPWHYIAIDDGESFDTLVRNPKGNVLRELKKRERELRDPNVQGAKKWQALAFYIHFVGDIHQPLHVRRRDDKGGSAIVIEWFGEKTNLHMVWDASLIERENLSFREYADFLDRASEPQIKLWQAADYLDYAIESKAMRAKAYEFGDQRTSLPKLGYKYHFKNIDDLNRRLLQAGIRLAGKLNEIFSL